LYNNIRKEKIKNIVPLCASLNMPSPAIGWNNEERVSIIARLKTDLVLALALVHHLAIAENIPLNFIAAWLTNMSPYLLIEFVPKEDEKVQLLLQNREDIFENYTYDNFKKVFTSYYHIIKEEKIGSTNRILFLMERNK
jgi:hypothetical protein